MTYLEAKLFKTYLHGVDEEGNNVFKKNYEFTQDDLSQWNNYVMKLFCPIMLEVNVANVSMKLITSRASITRNETAFNTHYSS